MPRKKKLEMTTDEPISVLQPETERQSEDAIAQSAVPEAIAIEELVEPIAELEQNIDPESCSRNYLTASLQSAQSSITGLFEAQAQLAGTQIADRVFDQLEEAFVNRLQERLQPFVDTLLPDIKDSHTEIQQRNTARVERRQSAFDRIKQIAATITDECKLLPPVVAVGEFVTWEPIETKENR
jgi:vacuolar-type H+-ATPase subunit I/STV1